MLCVLSFHNGDKQLAITLSEWIRELGGVSEHECLLVHMADVYSGVVSDILGDVFRKVIVYTLREHDPKKWPESANLMFRRAAHQIQATAPQPWLWLEPDAVPLRSTWLDEIEAEYKACGKPFMGARVKFKDVPEHMSGVAVYPGIAPTLAPGLSRANKVAFDVEARGEILPRMASTDLIQHEWRPAEFIKEADLALIRPATALFHQDKSGGAIRLLRARREPLVEQMERALFPAHAAPISPAKPLLPEPRGNGAETGGEALEAKSQPPTVFLPTMWEVPGSRIIYPTEGGDAPCPSPSSSPKDTCEPPSGTPKPKDDNESGSDAAGGSDPRPAADDWKRVARNWMEDTWPYIVPNLEPKKTVSALARALADIAAESPGNRIAVAMALRRAGLVKAKAKRRKASPLSPGSHDPGA